MKHCTKEQLGAFIDKELSPSEREEVLLHLSECSDCSLLTERWQGFGSALIEQPEPSEKFVYDVMRRVKGLEEAERSSLIERLFMPPWLAQGVGLAFAFALLFLSQPNGQTADEVAIDADSVLLSDFSDDLSLLAFTSISPENSILFSEPMEEL